MNQTVPLSVVFLVLGIGAWAYAVFKFVQVFRDNTAATHELSRAMTFLRGQQDELLKALLSTEKATHFLRDTVTPAAKQIEENMAGVPKLLEMVAKIGTAQLEIMQAQRAAAQKPANPFSRPNGPMPPRDAAAADLEHEIGQMMRSEGVSREEAMMRLNPANAGSVWDGNSFFQGWNR